MNARQPGETQDKGERWGPVGEKGGSESPVDCSWLPALLQIKWEHVETLGWETKFIIVPAMSPVVKTANYRWDPSGPI